MSRNRRIIAVLVAAVLAGFLGLAIAPTGAQAAISPTGAEAKTCESPAGSYEVSPPPAGSSQGADPAEAAAANCTLGFREEQAYPLSVIGLCLLASLGVLVLLRRRALYDAIGSEA